MPWRERPSLSPDEARQLHEQALVIDSQQPPVTAGFLFTERMREQLEAWREEGMSRADVAQAVQMLATREIQTSAEARRIYRDFWRRSGVTVACGTYSGSHRLSQSFEASVRQIAQAHAFIGALDGDLVSVLKAADIERIQASGKHGLILDFQNTTPFGDDPGRVALFYNLGIRMVQLTYNLQNLVGDGCTETYQGGLTYFGREIVAALNELGILVDVSHCSEQVGWDALQASTTPIVVSHSSSKTIAHHDRGKTDAQIEESNAGVLCASGLIAGEGLAGITIAGAVGIGAIPKESEPLLQGAAGNVAAIIVTLIVIALLYQAARSQAAQPHRQQ